MLPVDPKEWENKLNEFTWTRDNNGATYDPSVILEKNIISFTVSEDGERAKVMINGGQRNLPLPLDGIRKNE